MYRVSLGRMLDRQVDSSALETFSSIFTSKNSVEGLVTLADQPNNIRAINAVIGKRKIMKKAENTFISSTFWGERVGYTAALSSIAEFKRLNVFKKINNNM